MRGIKALAAMACLSMLCALTAQMPVQAEGLGTSITYLDSSGTPISGVVVKVMVSGSNLSGQSDESGKANFQGLTGNARILSTKCGYSFQSFSLTSTNIKLVPGANIVMKLPARNGVYNFVARDSIGNPVSSKQVISTIAFGDTTAFRDSYGQFQVVSSCGTLWVSDNQIQVSPFGTVSQATLTVKSKVVNGTLATNYLLSNASLNSPNVVAVQVKPAVNVVTPTATPRPTTPSATPRPPTPSATPRPPTPSATPTVSSPPIVSFLPVVGTIVAKKPIAIPIRLSSGIRFQDLKSITAVLNCHDESGSSSSDGAKISSTNTAVFYVAFGSKGVVTCSALVSLLSGPLTSSTTFSVGPSLDEVTFANCAEYSVAEKRLDLLKLNLKAYGAQSQADSIYAEMLRSKFLDSNHDGWVCGPGD
jgi:hypothetical protein